ncbi:MATE family efflux transporter [Halonatronum saccharophilum]|uniref:MATE family efflux transporter n=1 Tax=Halonatronum saccharophilum TaxID=150060 RepID=UPI0004B99F52|nr:MATE family efflux transporter [Halonatronum saccharophilum]
MEQLTLEKRELSTLEFLKKIIILATPAIIEMFMNTLVGLADTVMVGRGIGAEGLAAVNLANYLVFPAVFIFSAFNIGTTALVSRYIGARAKSRAERVASQSYMLNIIIGFILTVLMYFSHTDLIKLFPAEKEVLDIAIPYLRVVIYSQFFMLATFSLSSSFRGAGDTVTPMVVNGAVNLINILGNWLLIFGIGFFPQLGVRGAAISTTLSRIVGAIIFTIIALKGDKKIRLVPRWFKVKLKAIKKLWKISWSAALEQFFLQSSFIILNYLIIQLGTIDYSAYNIVLRIESISFMPAFGISIATTTLVGQYLGAKDKKNALRSGDLSALFGGGLAILLGAIFIAFPEELSSLFINDRDVIESAVIPLRLAGIQQFAISILIIYSGALRGAGDTLRVMFITIFRMWFLSIPLTYYIVNHTDLGLTGVYIGTNISFAIIATIFYLYFRSGKWMEIKL